MHCIFFSLPMQFFYSANIPVHYILFLKFGHFDDA
jgi:hypothetical protein